MVSRSYLVLRSHPDDTAVFEALYDAFDRLSVEHGFALEFVGTEETDPDLVQHRYQDTADRALLTLVNDWRAGAQYLMAEAPTPEAAERVTGTLRLVLGGWTVAELQAQAQARMEDEPETLLRMALGVGERADPRTVELLSRGARSDDPLVRFRAAEAAAIAGWPGLADVFRPLRDGDESPEVREMAGHAVAAAERTGPFGPPVGTGGV